MNSDISFEIFNINIVLYDCAWEKEKEVSDGVEYDKYNKCCHHAGKVSLTYMPQDRVEDNQTTNAKVYPERAY